MFLFPTAFVLSGVFTESLFLFLLIACFYYAKKKDWWKAGIAGFFLSLTRFWGVFVILPLLYEYLKARNFEIKRIRKDALWLLLVPLGLVLFSCYGYYKIGAYFSYWAVQSKAWGHMFTNPVAVLVNGTAISDVASLFGVFLAIAVLLLMFVFRKKTDFSYWLFSLFLIMAPLLANPNFTALPRYTLVAFASFIILAKLGKNNNLDSLLTIILSLLQGFLMVLFANGFKII
jgi:Gpi18-like mannosyltransferase